MNIGIITMMYGSVNSGGVLQAYALCKWLNDNGFNSSQIRFDKKKNLISLKNRDNGTRFYLSMIKATIKNQVNDLLVATVFREIYNRRKGFNRFIDDYIPATKKVYSMKDIIKTNGIFDMFIAGGDQIWGVYHYAYSLKFALGNKPVISYSPSMCRIPLAQFDEEQFLPILFRYDYLSVREDNSAEYLTNKLGRKVIPVVDPVFLINKNDWIRLIPSKKITEKYIFAYMLNCSETQENYVVRYAKQKGCKIVIVSNATGYIQVDSFKKADIKYNIDSPLDFLSLLYYAESVFTDSFHAVAFSIIFDKKFGVFRRSNKTDMFNRIQTILELVDAQDRVIDNEIEDKSFSTPKPLSYKKLEKRIEDSKSYLYNAITHILNNNG